MDKENLAGSPNHIFAMWHHEVFPSFVYPLFKNGKYSLINHPGWYMKHIHVMLYLLGIEKLVLGSTGNKGREAADRVVEDLKNGYTTYINPDGPYGPPMELKKGVLHMALKSGVPIVALRFLSPKQWIWKSTWEGKRFPLPFSTVTVIFSKPIYVTEDNFEEAREQLTKALG